MLKGVQDPHSFSNPDKARISHIKLDLSVNFLTKQFQGVATLDVTREIDAQFIILDVDDLLISSIKVDGMPVKVELGKKEEYIGQELKIPLRTFNKNPKIVIEYFTSPSAKGLIWRDAEQTDGKVQPLVYSHCQPTYASSIYPAQHSPMQRYTYDVTLRTPKELLGLMSSDKNPTELNPDGVYHFCIDKPIPSYLCSFAVGDFRYKRIGLTGRTGIYAEPVNLERAHAEFEDNEKVLALAEGRFGPYIWDIYNILVLPVDYPAGAMEHPWLSYFSKEYMMGEKPKERVRVVHHELSHSWFGNLVTAGLWGDLWLNEGLTTYGECILTGLIDPELADMLSAVYLEKYLEACRTMPLELISLKVDFSKTDAKGKVKNPRDNFSAIPYYKGFLFFKMLEQTLGQDNFNQFLRAYLEAHVFKSVTTEAFEAFLEGWLQTRPTLKAPANLKAWLYDSGIPTNIPVFSSKRIDRITEMVKGFMMQGVAAIASDYGNLANVELEYLIAKLAKENLTHDQIAALNGTFKFDKHPALNIREAWLVLCARKEFTAAYPALCEYVLYRKKPKLVASVFDILVKTTKGRTVALQLYIDGQTKWDTRGKKAALDALQRVGIDPNSQPALSSELMGSGLVAPMRALSLSTDEKPKDAVLTQTSEKDEKVRVKQANH